jgi:hypothetical protein
MLEIKAVPVPKGNKHPPVPFDVLPQHEFTMGLIAPKGSGKTTAICNMLYFYKGYFHTILVFSPTILSDDKWDWVKKQKLVGENKPLKEWIKYMENETKRKKDSVVENSNALSSEIREMVETEPFTGFIPENHFFDDYDDDTFKSIMEEQKKMISLLKKNGKPKHLANRILIIFDDLVGSTLFAGTKGSYFKGVNTRHRHYSASFLMISQGYKEVPKTIRTNWTALIVFEIGNEKEVEVIYEEFSMGLKRDQWMESYRHATLPDYSFIYFNFQKPKKLRVMMNFTNVLFHEVESSPNNK